jgi:uncharacterized protein YxjI
MRYVMQQKFISWGDDFTIKDEAGTDVYFVDGKAISFGDQLSFQDMSGNELAHIRQKVLSWGPTYEIYRNGELAAVVKKSLFRFLRAHFTVDEPGPDDLEAEGDFLDHEYVFLRGDKTAATVSKKFFTWRDTYGIDVADDEDPVLILASSVVVDMANHPDPQGNPPA